MTAKKRRHHGRPAPSFDVIPDGPLLLLTSSRTAPPSFDVIPDGAQRRAGIQTGAPQVPAPRGGDWIPASAGMTAKKRRHHGRPAPSFDVIPDGPPSFDVIPDGAQRRAGIQTGTPQVPAPRRCDWIPASAGMTAKNGAIPNGTLLLLMSSRTAHHSSGVIPNGTLLLLTPSRTVRPALDAIPDGAPLFWRHPGRRAPYSRCHPGWFRHVSAADAARQSVMFVTA